MTPPEIPGGPTSLYRCSVCGRVVRATSDQPPLFHVHDPVAVDPRDRIGNGSYEQFPDDGREGVLDLRDAEGRWFG